ncbi:MAG: hypothetical protein LPJ89_02810, partial [Hymenobacteraceae bacterium]|nr:hypothetical protein [Hymenobacteraceae bacterium]MDX5395719.1 hypothetical protein [Hymenobacteraceae bacterium]MDX5442696.1 hypothetical protein [Hymenobacteraceae bacterium]MDX5511771.1 hypothetical protein [Hymenobacteraceae bacterium]
LYQQYLWVGILIAIRYIAVFTAYLLLAKKLKERLSVILMPLLDVAYYLNYLFLGLSVVLIKKTRWK